MLLWSYMSFPHHEQTLKYLARGLFALTMIVPAGIIFLHHNNADAQLLPSTTPVIVTPALAPIDTAAYDKKMLELANIPAPVVVSPNATTTVTVKAKGKDGKVHLVAKTVPQKPAPMPAPSPWPAKNAAYPNPGALLPFNRIVAFYGNFYSKGMGILGQYPSDVVLQKLSDDVKVWQAADPKTPVIPAIHYIATTAQKYAGSDGKHILRMPASQIQKAIDLAKNANAIVFLDIQTGGSTIQTELPLLEPYLKLPQVHLGIDPEFSMKPGKVPGTVVGTMDASDINWAAQYLAKIVRDNNLTPKILVVHRFTKDAVTNSAKIKPLPEVQIVMDMDGWGTPDHKLTTYRNVIYPEPVQFTGFKIFYRNDLQKPNKRLMTPAEIMKLQPIPSYIQYQ